MYREWSITEQLLLVIVIGAGLAAAGNLVVEWLMGLPDFYGMSSTNTYEDNIFDPAPPWYVSKEWWWAASRKLIVVIGMVAAIYALTLGPWQELGLMLMLIIASAINRAVEHRQSARYETKVTVDRDDEHDFVLILVLLVLFAGGLSEPIIRVS